MSAKAKNEVAIKTMLNRFINRDDRDKFVATWNILFWNVAYIHQIVNTNLYGQMILRIMVNICSFDIIPPRDSKSKC